LMVGGGRPVREGPATMTAVGGTCFFFFQAEDGIRDKLVTGVQTCALPIYVGFPSLRRGFDSLHPLHRLQPRRSVWQNRPVPELRSEERRVGKECRFWWWSYC